MTEPLDSPRRKYGPSEARHRIKHWCARQERAQQEVRDKLYQWGLHGDDVEAIIAELITENFLNELRFAQAYVSGKFKIKKWGRVKIMAALQQKKVSSQCIGAALAEIDEDDYIKTLKALIEKKAPLLDAVPEFEQRHKMAAYLARKGYESELVWEAINAYYNPARFRDN